MSNTEKSFLSLLLKKKADSLRSGNEAGFNSVPLAKEVDRQIRQAMLGGNPLKGEGVTKSGGDD